MATHPPVPRDDRVLPYTRVLSAVIIPFLLLGFVLLYVFPGDTDRTFAWTISPTMTSMVLASAYLGGSYFFARVLRSTHWHEVSTGFLSVALFATLLGVATLVHWDRFAHAHVAFWVWSTLYFTTPFLVIGGWLANRRYDDRAAGAEPRLGAGARWCVGLVGLLALVQGVVMFVDPAAVIPVWPWLLTPLTCRVVGAVFCLGCAGVVVVRDQRWTTIRLMLQVEALMVALILVAAVRAHDQLIAGRPLTWLLLGGFVLVLVGSAYLWYAMEVRPRPAAPISPTGGSGT